MPAGSRLRDRLPEVAAAVVIGAVAIAGFIAVPSLVAGWAFAIPGTTDTAMAPSFFPRVALGTTAVIALLVAATAPMRTEPLPILATPPENWRRIALLFVVFGTYLVALRVVGFLLASMLLMAVMPLLVGYRRWLLVVTTAIFLPLAVSATFWFGLRAALPAGMIGSLFGWMR